LPGFRERLELEVRKLAVDAITKVRVNTPDNQDQSSWIGGSTLTSVPSFQNLWVTKAEYEEIENGVFRYKRF